jgi:1,4-dihydroxy-2-naphthoate octaprenyltransferase
MLLVLAYAAPLALALDGRPWAALPLATAPLALARLRALAAATDARSYNRCLAATAQLLLFHGALFAAGLAVS